MVALMVGGEFLRFHSSIGRFKSDRRAAVVQEALDVSIPQ